MYFPEWSQIKPSNIAGLAPYLGNLYTLESLSTTLHWHSNLTSLIDLGRCKKGLTWRWKQPSWIVDQFCRPHSRDAISTSYEASADTCFEQCQRQASVPRSVYFSERPNMLWIGRSRSSFERTYLTCKGPIVSRTERRRSASNQKRAVFIKI